MPRVKLTSRNVTTLPAPPDGQIDYWDAAAVPGGWFGLRVSARGTRVFTFGYRVAGRVRRMTLGPAGTLSLADARDIAREQLRKLYKGEDPQAEKRAARVADTLNDLARAFLEDGRSVKTRKPWRAKTRTEFERLLKVEILPRFGTLQPAQLTKGEIRVWAESIARRAPTLANRALAVLRLMYSWAERKDLVEKIPSFPEHPTANVRRDRVLNEDEIRAVWSALSEEQWIVAEAIRLMLLTGQRRGEVLSMRWKDLTQEAATGTWWTIPAQFAKNGLPHRVPLSAQAQEVVERLRVRTGTGAWVFPSPRGHGFIENPQKAAERLWKRAGVKDATLHDLRRTCASFIAALFGENGRFMVKKVLNHADRDGATTVYDRSTYDGPKRRALEAWGRRLEEIVTGKGEAKVVALGRA